MIRLARTQIMPNGIPGLLPSAGFWTGDESCGGNQEATLAAVERAILAAFQNGNVIIRNCRISFAGVHLVIEGDVQPPQAAGAELTTI